MSRAYAQTATSIWRPESDFNDLTDTEQRVYWLLKSQEDISAAGVLTLAVERWAGNARNTTPESIRLDLKGLVDARFIVIDDKTQEVLVRTFVKWDRGYGNQKRRPVIVRAALEVRSPMLRSVLAEELTKVGILIENLASPTSRSTSDRASVADGANAVADRAEPESSQVDSLSNGPFGTASSSDGVVATKAEPLEAPSLNPQPPTRDAIRAVADRVRAIRRGWPITTVENAIRTALAAGHTLAQIDTEFAVLAEDPDTRSPGRLNAPGRIWFSAADHARSPVGAAVDVHDFEPSDDDPAVCRCNAPRRNRRHTAAEGTQQ
jgi:hypothetical protein